MPEKKLAGLFLEIFVAVLILAVLLAVAVPQVSQMIDERKAEARQVELDKIKTAVTAMLNDSATGSLVPVGPTADMTLVVTSDTPPLKLSDYLLKVAGGPLKPKYTYIFAADGTVQQIKP